MINRLFLYRALQLPCQPHHQEQPGVQCLAQRHFNIWTGGVGDQTTNSVINGRPVLPAEAHSELVNYCAAPVTQ